MQDPYSLCYIQQVRRASRDAVAHAIQTVETEINSVTDNPLVFEYGDILNGGNFHGQQQALVLDYAKIAIAELASISERRTYLLLEGHNGLPKLLMEKTGINIGFMIPQYTVAGLVSENKVLAHPSSADSIPTSMGQEDHVSVGSIRALHLYQIYKTVEQVLAIELYTAAQALDFRKPMKPGKGVETAHRYIRSVIPHATEDHCFNEDVGRALNLLKDDNLIEAVEDDLEKKLQ